MAGGIWPAGCSSRIPGLWCQITGWDQPGEISSGMLMQNPICDYALCKNILNNGDEVAGKLIIFMSNKNLWEIANIWKTKSW